jgi:hypothetical protein
MAAERPKPSASELKHAYVKVRLPAMHRFLRISSAGGC